MKKNFFITIALTCLFGAFPLPLKAGHENIPPGRCLDCHVSIPLQSNNLMLFHEDIAGICRKCHKKDHGESALSHPVDVAPSMKVPSDMPLDINGRLSCVTCHIYHPSKDGKKLPKYLLRREHGMTFCFYCHQGFKSKGR